LHGENSSGIRTANDSRHDIRQRFRGLIAQTAADKNAKDNNRSERNLPML
jgi:hypothetical protein